MGKSTAAIPTAAQTRWNSTAGLTVSTTITDFVTLIYFSLFKLLACDKYFAQEKRKEPQTPETSLTGTVLACLECAEPQKSHFCSYCSLWKPFLRKAQHPQFQSPLRIVFRFEMWLISQSPGGFAYLTAVSFALNSRTVTGTIAQLAKPFSSPPLSPGSGQIKATPGLLPYQCNLTVNFTWKKNQTTKPTATQNDYHHYPHKFRSNHSVIQPDLGCPVYLWTWTGEVSSCAVVQYFSALTCPFLFYIVSMNFFFFPLICCSITRCYWQQGGSLVWVGLWAAPCTYGNTYRALLHWGEQLMLLH